MWDIMENQVNTTIFLDFEDIEKIELKKMVKLNHYGFNNIGKTSLDI